MAVRCDVLGLDRQALGADSIGSKRGINLLEFIIQKSMNLDFSPPCLSRQPRLLEYLGKCVQHTHTHTHTSFRYSQSRVTAGSAQHLTEHFLSFYIYFSVFRYKG